MNSFKSFSLFIFIILATCLAFNSCQKDDDNGSPGFESGNTMRTTVAGMVKDENNTPVTGATVKLGTTTATTDANGRYSFFNVTVSSNRFFLTVTKSGYFKSIKGTKPQSGAANYVDILLQSLPAAVDIQGSSGGTFPVQNGSVSFPADAFVDDNGNAYTGTVKMFARHINVSNNNGGANVPGGDLIGIAENGQTRSLYSLGMMEVDLYDNSGLNKIKLAPGKTATLSFPIDASQSNVAGNTIPLWHLNDESIWIEEGSATKVGNNYVGNVSHFSTWNVDYKGERCDIKGKVVDCQGNPVANVNVTIDGFMTVSTNNQGVYTTWVPVGYTITCQVIHTQNPTISQNSQLETFNAVQGLNIVPNLIIPCASRISGKVKTCTGNLNAPSLITFSWNDGIFFYYSEDGEYNIYVPVQTQLNISAVILGASGSVSVMSSSPGTTINAQDLLLCDSLNLLQSYFTLNNWAGTQTYLIIDSTTNSSFVDLDQNGEFESANIYISGFLIPGNLPVSLSIVLNQSVGNIYPLQNSTNNLILTIDGYFYTGGLSQNNITLNHIEILDYGVPGSAMTATFEFEDNSHNGIITNGFFTTMRN